MMNNKLIQEYTNLSGKEPDDLELMLIRGCTDPESYHWEKTGLPNMPFVLVANEEDDPCAPRS